MTNNSKNDLNHIVCLFDCSGLAGLEWAKSDYKVFCYDLENTSLFNLPRIEHENIKYINWDARDSLENQQIINEHSGRTKLMMAFPPCTDLAVSGAKHFERKFKENPFHRKEAMDLVYISNRIGIQLKCPYLIENPVSVISTEWRKPDYIFHPWEFAGWLPEDDVHPLFPDYIKARDIYPKKTCYWTGGNFKLSDKKPIEPQEQYSDQFKKLGGKSKKTKYIRSLTPRGVTKAIKETIDGNQITETDNQA